MHFSQVGIAFALLATSSLAFVQRPSSPHERLFDALFKSYNRDVAPAKHNNDTIEVKFGIAPIWLNVNEDFALEAKAWLR